ncbi:MAG: hypothetical protein ACPG4S_05365 [Schleiferiaceae bacterium]
MAARVRSDRGELQSGLSASLHQAQNPPSDEQLTADREHELMMNGMSLLEISEGDLRQQRITPGSDASAPFKVNNKEDLFELLFESRQLDESADDGGESPPPAKAARRKQKGGGWFKTLEALNARRAFAPKQGEENVINQTVVSPAYQFSDMLFFLAHAKGATVLFATSDEDEIKALKEDTTTLELKAHFSSGTFGLGNLLEDGDRSKVTIMNGDLSALCETIAEDQNSPYHDRMMRALMSSRSQEAGQNQEPGTPLLLVNPSQVKGALTTVGDVKRAMFVGGVDKAGHPYSPLIKWRSNNKEDTQIRGAEEKGWGKLTDNARKSARNMLSSLFAVAAFIMVGHHRCKTIPDSMELASNGRNLTEWMSAAKAYFNPKSKERTNCVG